MQHLILPETYFQFILYLIVAEKGFKICYQTTVLILIVFTDIMFWLSTLWPSSGVQFGWYGISVDCVILSSLCQPLFFLLNLCFLTRSKDWTHNSQMTNTHLIYPYTNYPGHQWYMVLIFTVSWLWYHGRIKHLMIARGHLARMCP